MSSALKHLLIVLSIIGIFGIGYLVLTSTTTPPPTSEAEEAERETNAILQVLTEIKLLDVDAEIFQDPKFLSLQDMQAALGVEQYGRPNPFSPVR